MTDIDPRALADEMRALDIAELPDELDAISDVEHATKVARWLRGALRERDRTLEPFDDEIADLTARRDDLAAGLNRRVEQLEDMLVSWHQAVLHDDPNRKTIELPYVKLSSRKTKGRFVCDRDEFEGWAREHGFVEAFQTVPEHVELKSNSELRKLLVEHEVGEAKLLVDGEIVRHARLLTPDGEIVPHAHIEDAGISHRIEPT